ncbi:hypothetical protein P3L10_014136 [Capsicum annuum]
MALFVAISVNLCWGPKVMALRDLPIDVSEMKGKLLLPLVNDVTCYRRCNSHSDCSDGSVCRTCSHHVNWDIFGHLEYWDCSVW